MIEKKKINFKKGIACLLAALQVGIVTSCAKSDISEKDYVDASEFVTTLELVSKSGDNLKNKSKLDTLSNDLVKEIGLTEEMLNDPMIKGNIAKLNGYIEEYKKAYFKHSDLYYVVKEGAEGEKIISVLNYLNVVIGSITKTNDYVYFNFDRPSRVYLDEPEALEFNYRMFLSDDSIVYDKGWYNEDSKYSAIHTHIFKDDEVKKESEVNYYSNNKHLLRFAFINNGKGSCTFKLSETSYDDYHFAYEPTSFKITETDYLILDNLLENLKRSDESLDILDYFKDTLLEIIRKYDKEKECQKYIDIIKNQKKIITLNRK